MKLTQLYQRSIDMLGTDSPTLPYYWRQSSIRTTRNYAQFVSLLTAAPSPPLIRIAVINTVPGILAIFAIERGNGAAQHRSRYQTSNIGRVKLNWGREYHSGISVESTSSRLEKRRELRLRKYLRT